MSEFDADLSFEATMSAVDGETLDEKKRTSIGHLLQHGHSGPFEHPTATFAIGGISRACVVRLTRHRHASFDVQSMRYVAFDEVDPAAVEAVNWSSRRPRRRTPTGSDEIGEAER